MSTATADRIAALRAEGEAAVAAASSTADLEEVRVRFLGRKAELPNLLRDVGKLPPEERGPVGKGANQARQALQAAGRSAPGRARGASSSSQSSPPTSSTSRSPARRSWPAGHLHILTATRREIEDVFIGLGFSVVEGPEIDLAYYNFDALNHDADHPARSAADTFYVADDVVLRTQTSPMQVRAMEMHAAAAVHHRPRPRLPARQRRHPHAAVPPGGGARGGRGPHARRPAGHAARVRPGDLRRRPRGPPAPALLPVHRALGRARRLAASTAGRASCKDGSRCPLCKGSALDRDPRRGDGRPEPLRLRRRVRLRRRAHQGFAWGMGIERIAFLKHRVPDLRMFFENDLRLLEQFG